ncbi:MAG: hypothetical protein ACRDVG_03940 [Jatrophihabitantaceae bacterium]
MCSDLPAAHVLDGVVAASPRDTRALYLIRVERNLVHERPLLRARSRFSELGPLPYEAEIDREQRRGPLLPSAAG